jgi:hypothetical protein
VDNVPMRDAAERLGISVAAVRQRIRRGTLESSKGDDGRWYVRIPIVPDAVPYDIPQADQASSALVDTLRSENTFLREQTLQQARVIESMQHDHARQISELHVMLQTAQRLLPATVPEPTAPREQSADSESPAFTSNIAPGGAQRDSRASWWRRLFGLE